jgi:glycosyltransferase involved in cell wall biosynthesis
MMSTSAALGRRYVPNPFAWVVNLVKLSTAAFRLNRELRRENVTLVCTKGLFSHFYGGLAARLAGIPCVWHVQDLVSDRAGGLYAAVMGVAGRLLAQRVIADGTSIRDQLAPYIPADRLIVLYNGVDTDQFSPAINGDSVRREWHAHESDILIGCVARLTAWKGQDLLIDAFGQVAKDFPQAKLVLVGSPVFDNDLFERRLRKMVADLQLQDRVIFAGFRWDLPQVLAALDIFAHASIEKDTSPLAVVSAMAAGKPIVTTQVAGVAELFTQDVDGILVPPKETRALAVALGAMLENPERRRVLGENARRKAEQSLTLRHFVEGCQRVFLDVIKANRHQQPD